MSDEYRALQAKVDAFCERAALQAKDALQCARGCAGCCEVSLSVSPVEAEAIRAHLRTLPPSRRRAIAARGERERARSRDGAGSPRCAMLDDDGSCSIYPARPLICRTQGLPLRYPPNTIPQAAVRFSARSGDVTACPLNYTQRAPDEAEILNAELVDGLLALVNQRAAMDTGGDPAQRSPLANLAVEAGVIASDEG